MDAQQQQEKAVPAALQAVKSSCSMRGTGRPAAGGRRGYRHVMVAAAAGTEADKNQKRREYT